MQIDDVMCYGETESESAKPSRVGAVFLAESIEDIRQEFGVDSNPTVLDGNEHLLRRVVYSNADAPSFGRELHSVGQDIAESLLKARRVSLQSFGAGCCGKERDS